MHCSLHIQLVCTYALPCDTVSLSAGQSAMYVRMYVCIGDVGLQHVLCGYTVNVQCFLNHMYSGMENMIKSQKESIAEMTARLQALQEEMEKVTDLWGHTKYF